MKCILSGAEIYDKNVIVKDLQQGVEIGDEVDTRETVVSGHSVNGYCMLFGVPFTDGNVGEGDSAFEN